MLKKRLSSWNELFRSGIARARFTEAGDTSGWAHHILWSAQTGDVEFALGETRWDDGRRIGTFMAVAQLGEDGRMVRYMTARSPTIEFGTQGRPDG